MTLDQLRPGDEARVVDIHAGPGVQRRLNHLGIHPGDTVRLSGRGAFRGPVLVEVHGMQVALGRGVARHVLVDSVSNPPCPRRQRRFRRRCR